MSAAEPAPDYTIELPDRSDPEIGRERVRVTHADGRVQEFPLHDYAQLYALPGAYEQVVTERLQCRSPWVIAALLRAQADGMGVAHEWRVIDLAAGNGVSGEALAAQGLRPVLGCDIEPAARTAALRDRPGLYGEYLTVDLLALAPADAQALTAARANALACVAPVGAHPGELPVPALAAAVAHLAPDALVAVMHDPRFGEAGPLSAQAWRAGLGATAGAELLARERYVHRRTVTGRPFEMVATVWRIVRPPAGAQAQ